MSVFSSFGNSLFGVPEPDAGTAQAIAAQAQQQARQYAGREQSDYNSESQLADQLKNVISGAQPSVASTELQKTLGQNLAANTAMGAGSTGVNAVLARYAAMKNQGDMAADAAQTGALLRAREIAQNQQLLGGLYGQMGQRSAGLYGTTANTGLGYANLGNNIAQANADRAMKTEAAGLQFLSGIGSTVIPGIRGLYSGGANTSVAGDGFGGLNSSDPAVSNAAWADY